MSPAPLPPGCVWVLVWPVGIGDTNAFAGFFNTDIEAEPEQILAYYALRWNIEVFFEEVLVWLGFEKQRGWCNSAIIETGGSELCHYM